MKKIYFLLFTFFVVLSGAAQTNIIPIRDAVAGFGTWTDASLGSSTTYLQLTASAGASSSITPTMDLTPYPTVTLDFAARTFGGINATKNLVTISISTDGVTWSSLTSRLPTSSTLTAVTQINLSAYNTYSTVRLKFEALASDGTIGAGVDDLDIKGTCISPTTQATFTSITGVLSTSMTVDFSAGSGGGRILAISTSPITSTPGSNYTGATNNYSTTTKALSGGEKVVYSGTGTTSVNVTGLSANTLYYVKVFEHSASYCYNTTTAGGSATTLCNTPTTVASLPVISSITGTGATITWTNGSGSNRLVLLNASSAPTGIPANGSTYTANPSYTLATVIPTGTGKVLYNSTANTFAATGLTSNTTYYGAIYEFNNTSKCYMNTGVTFNFNTLSNKSDIISAAGESSCISSLLNNIIATSSEGTEVWQFTLRDGGSTLADVDGLPTIINSLVITQGTSNTVNNWTDIQSAALFDGATFVSSATISSTSLTFSGLTYNIPDNTSKTLSLRITLKAVVSSPATIDNRIFRFSITVANITVAPSGSSGKDASASVATTDVTKNKVCVVATKLVFTQQPSNTVQTISMSPDVKVTAYDANNNIDLGFTGIVTITSTGTVLSGTTSVTAIAGVATYASLKHSNISTGSTLTATSGALSIVSNTFNITADNLSSTFLPGDFAIVGINTGWTNYPVYPAAIPPNPTTNNSSADEISFVIFKDMIAGTSFHMTDNGYERNAAGKFGGSEGIITITRKAGAPTLPAGSIVTLRGIGGTGSLSDNRVIEVRVCGAVDATNWTINLNTATVTSSITSFDLNSTDQLWFMQGGAWTTTASPVGSPTQTDYTTYTGGNVLFGWSGTDWKKNVGTVAPIWACTTGSGCTPNGNQGSTVYPNMNCFSNTLGGTSGISKVKYTGAGLASNFTTTTKLGWIARISNPANWSFYVGTGSDAAVLNYNSNGLYQAATSPNTDYGGYNGSPVCSFSVSAATEVEGMWTGAKSTDWFDCNNWDTKTVPDPTISVTIPSAAIRASLVDNNSAFAYLASNKADCLDLTIDGKTLSTGASDDIININGNFTLKTSGGALNMTNGGIVNIQNGIWSHILPATFTSGAGTVAFNSSNTQTIPAESFNNLTSTSTGERILTNSGFIGIKGAFTQGTNIYTVTGSTVDFNGSAAQNIPGLITINSSPYTNQYNILKTSNAGTKTTTGDFTILDNIDIGTGTTLATANEITIKSDAIKTARVAPVGGTLTYSGSGKFNIERYLPMQTPYSGRRWRLLGVPLSAVSAPTVLASWQEGATVTSSTIDITSLTNPNPGYGTHITNGVGNSNNGNGFDAGSTVSPSIYKIQPGTAVWTQLTTTGDAITNYDAYMLFARGNRSIVVSSPYINTTGSTNLRMKGRINVGNITKNIVTGKQAISNPYASAISMKNVTYLGTPMATTGKTYYVWDPKLLGSKNVGSWVTFSGSGGTTFTSVPKPADSAYMSVYDNVNGTVESGGAIFLDNISGAATTMIFHESDKSTTSSIQGVASRPARANRPMETVSSFYTNLAFVNDNGDPVLADGVATTYHSDFNNIVDDQDAPKLLTFLTREKISLLRNDSILAIERRNTITVDDTIFLQMNRLDYNYNYQLQFIGENFAPELTAFLIDKFLNTETTISTEGLTRHNFSTNGTEASINVDRFKVVFKKLDPVPVTFISITATLNNAAATVTWKMANEMNIKYYDVEKSVDGIHFTKIAMVNAVGSINYNFVDENAIAEINYYRLVSVSTREMRTYSNIVKVKRMNNNASITLYSNPLKEDGVLALQLANMPIGKYTFNLYNNWGQLYFKKDNSVADSIGTTVINLGTLSTKGVYHLKIIKPDRSIKTIKVIF
ncbi:MAG: hypothetical protein V4556_10165 [Bacteroidota bacterium]